MNIKIRSNQTVSNAKNIDTTISREDSLLIHPVDVILIKSVNNLSLLINLKQN